MKTILIVSLLVCAALAGTCLEDCNAECRAQGMTNEAVIWHTCHFKCDAQISHHIRRHSHAKKQICIFPKLNLGGQQEFLRCMKDCDVDSRTQGMTNEAVIWHTCHFKCDKLKRTMYTKQDIVRAAPVEGQKEFDVCMKDCDADCRAQGMTNEAVIWHTCHFKCDELKTSVEEPQ